MWRTVDRDGRLSRDVIAPAEAHGDGTPLLVKVMAGGKRIRAPEPRAVSRDRAASELARLPEALRGLAPGGTPWTPDIDPALDALARETDAALGY